MILNDDIRTGILVGLCLVGDVPPPASKILFGVLAKKWDHIPMYDVMDGELRDAIAKDCGIPSETPEQ